MIYFSHKKGDVYVEKNRFFSTIMLLSTIRKKYLLEQKIRLLNYPSCSPDLNPIENLWGLIVAKVYKGGRQYSAISELKNAILDAWEKCLRFNFRNLLIVYQSEFLRLSKLTVDLQNIK